MIKTNDTLTFEESDRLKGLLILLVILGHIEQLFSGENAKLQMLLYSFHVVSFFFLPFLFNRNHLSLINIKKNLKRIYIPYTFFYFLSVLIYSIVFHKEFSYDIFIAWIIGTGPLVKATAGFAFFWFFTALLSTVILIMLYNSLSKTYQNFFLFIMFSLHLIISLLPSKYLIYFPFSLYVPLYLFIIGQIIKYIYSNLTWDNYMNFGILCIFAILLYILYGTRFNLASPLLPNIIHNPIDFLMHDFVFIIGFFTMIYLSRSFDFFTYFGKYSLAFFTIHPFIIQILNRTYHWDSILGGVVKYILVVFITYSLVKLVYRFKIDRIIYPR